MITNTIWNPRYHIMPPYGWMNDPNGLCQFKGLYHVFFQYRPEAADGSGQTFWGHYTGTDLFHWKFEGKAIAPDAPFDRTGAYSGSALCDQETMNLYYTGNVKQDGDFDYIYKGREANTILVTSRDGKHFSEKQLLMTNADYPADLSCHIRDPKVWKDKNGYHMIQGARTKEDKGEVVLFASQDGIHWTVEQILTTPEPFGYMWECPDLMDFGGDTFLSLCPQGVPAAADGFCYQNIYQSGYFRLQENRLQDFREWDRGFDFYAPQSFLDHQGRRLFFGWMGMPDTPQFHNPTVALGWQHTLTLPRELHVEKQGEKAVICQMPARELYAFRTGEQLIEAGTCTEEESCLDAVIENDGQAFSCWMDEDLLLHFDPDQKAFSFTFTGGTEGIGQGRDTRKVRISKVTRMEIVADVSCIEVFLNQGEEVFTSRIYPKNGKNSLHLDGKGCHGKIWRLA